MVNGTDAKFLSKVQQMHGNHKHYIMPKRNNCPDPDTRNCFGVVHFAGDVFYNVRDFVEKNKVRIRCLIAPPVFMYVVVVTHVYLPRMYLWMRICDAFLCISFPFGLWLNTGRPSTRLITRTKYQVLYVTSIHAGTCMYVVYW